MSPSTRKVEEIPEPTIATSTYASRNARPSDSPCFATPEDTVRKNRFLYQLENTKSEQSFSGCNNLGRIDAARNRGMQCNAKMPRKIGCLETGPYDGRLALGTCVNWTAGTCDS